VVIWAPTQTNLVVGNTYTLQFLSFRDQYYANKINYLDVSHGIDYIYNSTTLSSALLNLELKTYSSNSALQEKIVKGWTLRN